MPAQKPSVCRIVRYLLPPLEGIDRHRPAAVTYVHPNGSVDLNVLLSPVDPESSANKSALMESCVAEGDAVGQWSWPPREPLGPPKIL